LISQLGARLGVVVESGRELSPGFFSCFCGEELLNSEINIKESENKYEELVETS
jgi:hypothetical protein